MKWAIVTSALLLGVVVAMLYSTPASSRDLVPVIPRFAAMIVETPTAARLRQLVWHRGEPEANSNIRVWANRRSGFYYCPKTKFYGKMSPGAYMVQWDALQRGYRPADAQACQ